ncbi:unnamed protein product [Nesidiocoris tenuis]|uniref:Uncharacterized protein n=1 Tax=Nesidiocoris tenuis TaxID=355587 RepID=A0A6H5HUB6_9HEMI|nr:unnamed protein product [Nesidiocoris tenuis]
MKSITQPGRPPERNSCKFRDSAGKGTINMKNAAKNDSGLHAAISPDVINRF